MLVRMSLKGQLDSKNIELHTQIDADIPEMVIGDKFKVEHVLANFVSNAVKFSPNDSNIWITVSYEEKATSKIKVYIHKNIHTYHTYQYIYACIYINIHQYIHAYITRWQCAIKA